MSEPDSTHQTVAMVIAGLMLLASYYEHGLALLVLSVVMILVAVDGERRRRSAGGVEL